MTIYYIYSLKDPISGAIRYVGATMNPYARLHAHMSSVDGTPAKKEWVQGLRESGLSPIMDILEKCTSTEAAAEREKHFYSVHNNGELVCADPVVAPYTFVPGRRKPVVTETVIIPLTHQQILKGEAIAEKKGIGSLSDFIKHVLYREIEEFERENGVVRIAN